MHLSQLLLIVFFSSAASFASSSAAADEPRVDDDPYTSTEADTLFKQGVARMLKGELEEGCPAIEHSYELDPRPGTLFTLGECEAQRGRLATAVRHLRRFVDVVAALPAARQSRYAARMTSAEKRCAELEPLVPRLVLTLPPDAPWTTEVELDGERVDLGTLQAPRQVDPGTHTLTVQVPGNRATSIQASVVKGETKAIPLPVELPAKPCAPAAEMATNAGGCAGCTVGSEDAPSGAPTLILLCGLGALLRARRRPT